MKYCLLLFVSLLSMTTNILAVTTDNLPANIEKTIPSGWHVFDVASGDLNQDEQTDYAIIIEKDTAEPHMVVRFFSFNLPPYINSHALDEYESSAAPRKILVYFGASDGSYTHTLTHSDWVERADFGGMLGDSYDGLKVENGAVVLNAFGGSREKWRRTVRVRHEAAGWRMIGLSEYWVDGMTLKSEFLDRNLLTYKIHIERHDQGTEMENYWDEIADKTKIYLRNELK